MTELYPFQIEGARFLASKSRALLADEMGLGKTAQAIAACAKIVDDRPPIVWVVCPASVQEVWWNEFDKFWPANRTGGFFLSVFSYNVAAAVASNVRGHPGCDILILDEAHYLKSRRAKRTKAILGPKCDGVGGLAERAGRIFMLTGTPMPNAPNELWTLLRAGAPETIRLKTGKPANYWQFVSRYCRTRHNGFGIEILGGKNLEELSARIAPFVLRRRKAEVLADLPPIRFDTLSLEADFELPAEARGAADEVAAVLAEHGVAGLAKIAAHVATLRRLTGLAKVAPAGDWIADWLDGGSGKLVVFAHHREALALLGERFADVSVALTGGATADARAAVVECFQNVPECRLFLGNLQAAGVGITLHAASDVLFVESSWVPAENEQAAMRVHRIGQKNACLVRFATLAGSIDERIQKAVMRKTADIAALFG